VVGALGDRVTRWSTLNEPLCSAWLGYLSGDMAPGIEDVQAAFSASHHLLLGHGLAVRAARAVRPNIEMGIVMNVGPAIPASDSPADRDAARRADLTDSHWFHDPVYLGSYPQEVIDFSGVTMPIQSDDMKIISERLDWHGLNYYFPAKIADDPGGDGARTHWGHIDGPKTDMGWGIDASVMRDFLIKLKTHWKTPKIYITENGSAWPDTVAPDGRIYDPEREKYLMEHLSAAAEAIEAGVDLRGYFGWSLLDNYEWAYGYDKRFGYAYVDYPTQKRTIKESGRAFSRLIRASRGG
jgi:beta-glucosidase